MERTATILTLLALAPLLMGGGGAAGFTAVPSNFVPTGDEFRALVTMDPHEPSATPTAKLGYIELRDKQGGNVSAMFQIPPGFALFFGCDTSKTQERFVGSLVGTVFQRVRLQTWIDADLVGALFARLGTTVDNTTAIPAITEVLNGNGNGACMNQTTEGTGWLFMDAVVRVFVEPKNR